MTLLGVEVLPEVAALGVAFGLVYGLLAVGLVLMFRTSGVLNFAHADVGVLGATLVALAVTHWHVPYPLALLLAVAVGVAVGAVTEVVVVRRLRAVPLVMTVVATLGLGQALLLVAAAIAGPAQGVAFPGPPGLPTFELGALHVGRPVAAMLLVGPLAAAGLAAWLARTRTGLELRAAAANASAARLVGIPAARLSAAAWGIAGGLSVVTAALVGAAPGFIGGSLSGPTLLLRALTAAVLARMTSLPGAMLAGVLVGVTEQVVLWNVQGGLVEAVLLAAVLGVFVTRNARPQGGDPPERWMAVEGWRPLPPALRDLPGVRLARRLAMAAAIAAVAVAAATVNNSVAVRLTSLVAFAIVAQSVGIVTGLAGRLTLGQFALAGVGAVASLRVLAATGSTGLALAAAAVTAGAAAVVVGLPALRVRGPLLAVATLGLALVTEAWLLPQAWALGPVTTPERLRLGGLVADTGRRSLVLALLIGAVVLWLVRNLRASGIGRRLKAVRDSPDAARALGIDPARTTVLAFAAAGMVAGVGGVVLAHSLTVVTPSSFPAMANVTVVAMAVVGGIGTLAGPLLGALFVVALPLLVPLDAAGLATMAFGWFLLVVYVPQGLAAPARWIRDQVVDQLAARAGHDPTALRTTGPDRAPRPPDEAVSATPPMVLPGRGPGGSTLLARGLARSFGGVRAVAGVDLDVGPGEIVGLMGANGAGKTTVVDLLAGFVPPDHGRVRLDGRDVTHLPASTRARRGIVRSFQDPRGFPTLTVQDAVCVALEHAAPTRVLPALTGTGGRARRVRDQALALLEEFGLAAHAHVPVRTLSTGMRRVCELACLSAMAPRVLLLDEPSAGLADAEVARLVALLRGLHQRLGTSLVVVEHDLALVGALADRVIVMEDGGILAEGTPDDVLGVAQRV